MKTTEDIRLQVKVSVSAQAKVLKKKDPDMDNDKLKSIIVTNLNMMGLDYDDDDVGSIFSDLEYEVFIRHTPGAVIFGDYEREHYDWYTELNLPDNKQVFWNNYVRYLQQNDKMDANSLKLLSDTTLPNILNLLADPNEQFDGSHWVRGLLIGDVQSGKTSTYIGLISKAADAGYKVVILLAGITENLRVQTQERVDEGIVGYTVRKVDKKEVTGKTGVGLFTSLIPATSFTTSASDFTKSKTDIVTSLQQHKSLVLFVVKKNVTVLGKLYKWLKDQNLDPVHGYVDAPMLLIDDEADNASVNTKKEDSDPTRTNKVIRNICGLFKNATYLGVTATPFANIFIDPESEDAMKQADLFPQDFIYTLPTPSSYIGAKKLFEPDGPYYNNLRFIGDIEEPDYSSEEYKDMVKNDIDALNEGTFYYQHKKEWDGELPASLREACLAFLIANVIRDCRGDISAPKSMLINMSRFVKVQKVIKEYVSDLHHKVLSTVTTDFSDKDSENYNLPLYKELLEVWKRNFKHIGIEYSRILKKKNLLRAIKDIQVMVVNGSKTSDKLDYKANPSLRVIAVGGQALSRGLTLEGLIVSYFYRNTATFDVLMQMGRWFGYRMKYDDVFMVWAPRESAMWYAEISEASEELKEDIRTMFEQRLTPKDFGLKVRNNCRQLRITAANKMRTAADYTVRIAYYGNIYDTPYLSLNASHNSDNLSRANRFAKELFAGQYAYRFADVGRHPDNEVLSDKFHDSRFFESVPKATVREFLQGIKCSMLNPNFNVEYILSFIDNPDNTGLDYWDVVFEGGDSKKPYQINALKNINCVKRQIFDHGNAVQISSRRRILGTREGDFCLDHQTAELAKTRCRNQWATENIPPAEIKKKDIPLKAYFQYLPHRKPILIIMLIEPEYMEDPDKPNGKAFKKFQEATGNDQLVAFAIGFPGLRGEESANEYKVNKTWLKVNGLLEDEYNIDEDEYDG